MGSSRSGFGGEGFVAVLLLVFGAAFVALAWRLMRRQPTAGDDRLWRDVALVVTLMIVAIATLLTASGRDEPPQLKLLPFANLIDAVVGNGSVRGTLAEMAANVVLFIPLGMALCWRFPALGVARVAIAAAGISIGVEVFQALSQSGRWASTTDVIMNGLGAMIGALAAGIGHGGPPVD